MRKLLLGAAVLALSTGMGLAQSVADQVVAGLQAQGFTRIEVKTGPTQVKVEAIRGETKVEYVYDTASGELIKQETEAVDADDDTSPGVEYDERDEDFVDVGDESDDDGDLDDEDGDDADEDDDGDSNRGHGNDEDGFDEDNPGRGNGGRDDDDDDGDRGNHGGKDNDNDNDDEDDSDGD